MKKLLILAIPLLFMGCSSLTKGAIQPSLANLNANDMQAVKTGDIAPIKGKVEGTATLDTNAQIGLSNSTQRTDTSAGRDMQISNDATLMKEYIQALKASHTELIDVMWKIIYLLVTQLLSLALSFITLLGFCLKFLLKSDKEKDERDSDRLDKILEKGDKNV